MNLSEIFAGAFMPSKWRALGEYLSGRRIVGGPGVLVREAGGHTVISVRRRNGGGGGANGPFWPTLVTGGTPEAPTYSVIVTRGVICERVTSDADAVKYFEPVVLTGDVPTEFPITDTQIVCVHFETDDTGAITGTPTIEVVDSDQESIHYIPPVGTTTAGTDGDYYYKLAAFSVGPPAKLTMFLAGDNIDHFRELPMIVKAGGTADVFKEFNASAGKFKTRGLTGGDGITVTENASDIEIKIDGAGLNFNLLLRDIAIVVTDDGSGGYNVGLTNTYEPDLLYVRNGMFVAPNADVVDEYSVISRLTHSSSSQDTGPIFTDNTP